MYRYAKHKPRVSIKNAGLLKTILLTQRQYHSTNTLYNNSTTTNNTTTQPITTPDTNETDASNNESKDKETGDFLDLEPPVNTLYIPDKISTPPKRREMWELMSEIFVPTGNVANMMTRYHIKAHELLQKKRNQRGVDLGFNFKTKATYNSGGSEELSILSKSGKRLSLYDLLADTEKLDKEAAAAAEKSNDRDGLKKEEQKSMYEKLQLEQDFYAKPTSMASASENIKDSEKTEVLNEDNALMMFFDDPMSTSTILYWPCGTLNFLKSDFERLIPYPKIETDLPSNHFLTDSFDSLDTKSWRDLITPEVARDMSSFRLVRCRDPNTLVRWIGYYLIFPTRLSAALFYRISLTSEICGLIPQFRFVPADSSFTGGMSLNGKGFSSNSSSSSSKPKKSNSYLDPKAIDPPILSEVPGVTREMCVLVSGLPPKYSPISIAKQLWEFDLWEDQNKAIVKLKGNHPNDSESLWLIRFRNTDEPKRIRKLYHKRQWPNTNLFVDVEILD